jgi:hypothetical protein
MHRQSLLWLLRSEGLVLSWASPLYDDVTDISLRLNASVEVLNMNRFVQRTEDLLLLFAPVAVNAPEMKLLDELVVLVLVSEFGIDLTIIAEVIDNVVETLAITIEEDLTVDRLKLMHVREHLRKNTFRH